MLLVPLFFNTSFGFVLELGYIMQVFHNLKLEFDLNYFYKINI